MKRWAWLAIAIAACGPNVDLVDDDGSATSGDESSGTTRSDPGNPTEPEGTNPCPSGRCDDTSGVPPDPTVDTDNVTTGIPPIDDPCSDHLECASSLCLSFSDAPPDPLAYCEDAPGDGATRITGTVRSLSTQAVVAGADVVAVSVLGAAADPPNPNPLAAGSADGSGRLDMTSDGPLSSPIGVAAIATAPGFYRSITGVASPADDGTYPPGNAVHDLWVVAEADLDLWSDLLAADPAANMYLPLGDAGGFIGLVRDVNGAPIAGAVVEPVMGGSSAVVRYPGFGTIELMATTEAGIFIVLGPQLAEQFLVIGPSGEAIVSTVSTSLAVFTAGVVL